MLLQTFPDDVDRVAGLIVETDIEQRMYSILACVCMLLDRHRFRIGNRTTGYIILQRHNLAEYRVEPVHQVLTGAKISAQYQ